MQSINDLDLQVRKDLYSAIDKYAGAHFRQLQRKTNLATATLRHHLHYLTKIGIISEEKQDNNLRYYTVAFAAADKELLGLLRQRSVRQILLAILVNDPCYAEDIARTAKLSPSTVSFHLKKLDGLVLKSKTKKPTYTIKEKNRVISVLITYKDSFYETVLDNIIDMWQA